MLLFPLFAVVTSFATAVSTPGTRTVTLHPELPPQPPSEDRPVCIHARKADEVYIVSNPFGKCGPNDLGPCTESATKVGDLCMGICVRAVNATTGDPAKMYGLSHPRINGGFFVLYNGTDCEPDTMYLEYRAQRVGTGPVRFVQGVNDKRMEVSPFMSFYYLHTDD